MEDERFAKQVFLKESIIDKGFDAGQFTSFCMNLKGIDIDNYTFDELEEIVFKFQSLVLKNERRRTLGSENEETRKSVGLTEVPKKQFATTEHISVKEENEDNYEEKEKIIYDYAKVKENSSQYKIKAVQVLDNPLSTQGIVTAKLNPAESISTGKLSGSKFFFPIETSPLGWFVKRHLDDFIWLRETLTNNFPGVYLPPFPPKRFRNSTDANSKQQYYLEKFINCMLRNPLLRKSSYLLSFLSETDPKLFQEVKKKSSKEKKLTKLEEFWTIDGKVICDPIINESETASVNEYLSISESMKKKLKRQSDEIISTLQKLAGLVSDASKSFENLENIQSFIPDITGLKPLYNSLKSSFGFWATHETNLADLLKEHFNMFFKYAYNEIKPMREMVKERDQKVELYLKTKGRLESKKEKLWIAGDVNKWGLESDDLWNAGSFKADKMAALGKMLRKETVELDRMKDDYAYFNYQSRVELKNFLLDNQILENLHFSEFARDMCSLTTKFHVNWGELIGQLNKIRKDNVPARTYLSKDP